MIPLRDNVRSSRLPVVNYALIACCALVFLGQLKDASDGEESLVQRFGMIPARVSDPGKPIQVKAVVVDRFGRHFLETREAAAPPFTPWLTLLTCIFLHGGWMHFLGNMWFLYIFGDNVEDRLGHLGYLCFYLGSGVAASAAHLLTNASSPIPTIGASGAIAGVMGAYFLLYPRATVLTLLPLFFFIEILVLPAPLFLGIWFLLQFFQGTFAITSMETGGVAWWAHIGGFVVGVGVVYFLKQAGLLPRVQQRYLSHARRPTHYRYRRW